MEDYRLWSRYCDDSLVRSGYDSSRFDMEVRVDEGSRTVDTVVEVLQEGFEGSAHLGSRNHLELMEPIQRNSYG